MSNKGVFLVIAVMAFRLKCLVAKVYKTTLKGIKKAIQLHGFRVRYAEIA